MQDALSRAQQDFERAEAQRVELSVLADESGERLAEMQQSAAAATAMAADLRRRLEAVQFSAENARIQHELALVSQADALEQKHAQQCHLIEDAMRKRLDEAQAFAKANLQQQLQYMQAHVADRERQVAEASVAQLSAQQAHEQRIAELEGLLQVRDGQVATLQQQVVDLQRTSVNQTAQTDQQRVAANLAQREALELRCKLQESSDDCSGLRDAFELLAQQAAAAHERRVELEAAYVDVRARFEQLHQQARALELDNQRLSAAADSAAAAAHVASALPPPSLPPPSPPRPSQPPPPLPQPTPAPAVQPPPPLQPSSPQPPPSSQPAAPAPPPSRVVPAAELPAHIAAWHAAMASPPIPTPAPAPAPAPAPPPAPAPSPAPAPPPVIPTSNPQPPCQHLYGVCPHCGGSACCHCDARPWANPCRCPPRYLTPPPVAPSSGAASYADAAAPPIVVGQLVGGHATIGFTQAEIINVTRLASTTTDSELIRNTMLLHVDTTGAGSTPHRVSVSRPLAMSLRDHKAVSSLCTKCETDKAFFPKSLDGDASKRRATYLGDGDGSRVNLKRMLQQLVHHGTPGQRMLQAMTGLVHNAQCPEIKRSLRRAVEELTSAASSYLFADRSDIPLNVPAEVFLAKVDETMVGTAKIDAKPDSGWGSLTRASDVVQTGKLVEHTAIKEFDPHGKNGLTVETLYDDQQRAKAIHEKYEELHEDYYSPLYVDICETLSRRTASAADKPDTVTLYMHMSVMRNAEAEGWVHREDALRKAAKQKDATDKQRRTVAAAGSADRTQQQQIQQLQQQIQQLSQQGVVAALGTSSSMLPPPTRPASGTPLGVRGGGKGGKGAGSPGGGKGNGPPAGNSSGAIKAFTNIGQRRGVYPKMVRAASARAIERLTQLPTLADFKRQGWTIPDSFDEQDVYACLDVRQDKVVALYEQTDDARVKEALGEVRPRAPWGGVGEPAEPSFSSDIAKADQDRACWPDWSCLGCAHGEPFHPERHKAYAGDDGQCCPELACMFRNPQGGAHNPTRCDTPKVKALMMGEMIWPLVCVLDAKRVGEVEAKKKK